MKKHDEEQIKQLRKTIFLTACRGNTGHLASAFSVVELLYALYFKGFLKYDSKNPKWEHRDRLIVSKGHSSLALYSVLHASGYFDDEFLQSFCQMNSSLGGEPTASEVPGVETATGSLGHGLSFGVGAAIAKKIDGTDEKFFVILGDGECQEGTIWEAVMSAVAFKLDNLTVLLDCNKVQKMGTVEEIIGIPDWTSRWESFGFTVQNVDGHNVDQICEALQVPNVVGKPRVIIANTIKGKGVKMMEGDAQWHWRMPTDREIPHFMHDLEISQEELDKCKKHI